MSHLTYILLNTHFSIQCVCKTSNSPHTCRIEYLVATQNHNHANKNSLQARTTYLEIFIDWAIYQIHINARKVFIKSQ
jgi:hypothetical protein